MRADQGHVLLIAGDSIQCFGTDDVESAGPRFIQQLGDSFPAGDAGAGSGFVLVYSNDVPPPARPGCCRGGTGCRWIEGSGGQKSIRRRVQPLAFLSGDAKSGAFATDPTGLEVVLPFSLWAVASEVPFPAALGCGVRAP